MEETRDSHVTRRVWPLFLCMLCSAVVAIGLWEGLVRNPQPAYGAEPFYGSGRTIQKAVEEQKVTNKKLDELIALLKKGPINVTLVEPSKPAKSKSPRQK